MPSIGSKVHVVGRIAEYVSHPAVVVERRGAGIVEVIAWDEYDRGRIAKLLPRDLPASIGLRVWAAPVLLAAFEDSQAALLVEVQRQLKARGDACRWEASAKSWQGFAIILGALLALIITLELLVWLCRGWL